MPSLLVGTTYEWGEGEGVEVDVEPPAEALDDGEGAGAAMAHTVLPRLAAVEIQERPDEDAKDRAAEAVVPGEEVAQAVGEAQHPLADGDVGEHTIHEVGGPLDHAPAAATGAEAAAVGGRPGARGPWTPGEASARAGTMPKEKYAMPVGADVSQAAAGRASTSGNGAPSPHLSPLGRGEGVRGIEWGG